jgi:hypothetical protein
MKTFAEDASNYWKQKYSRLKDASEDVKNLIRCLGG